MTTKDADTVDAWNGKAWIPYDSAVRPSYGFTQFCRDSISMFNETFNGAELIQSPRYNFGAQREGKK